MQQSVVPIKSDQHLVKCHIIYNCVTCNGGKEAYQSGSCQSHCFRPLGDQIEHLTLLSNHSATWKRHLSFQIFSKHNTQAPVIPFLTLFSRNLNLLQNNTSQTRQEARLVKDQWFLKDVFYPTSFPISKTSLFHLRLYSSFKTFIKQFWICKFLHHILEYFSCSVQFSFSYENIYYLHYYSVSPTCYESTTISGFVSRTPNTHSHTHTRTRAHTSL